MNRTIKKSSLLEKTNDKNFIGIIELLYENRFEDSVIMSCEFWGELKKKFLTEN